MIPAIYLFLLSLLGGQLIRIPIIRGITIYGHDLALCILGITFFLVQPTTHVMKDFRVPEPMKLFSIAILFSLAVNLPFHTISESLEGIAYACRIFFYGLLFIIARSTKKEFDWVSGLYWIGVVFALLGVLQYVLYPDLRYISYLGWDPHYYRLVSTFFDPNYSGIFLLLTGLAGFYLHSKGKHRFAVAVAQTVLCFSLILTLSRSTLIAAGTCIIIYVFWKRSWTFLAVGMCFLLAVVFLPLPNRTVTPMLRMSSSWARIVNWQQSVGLFIKKPIEGYGFNLLRSVHEKMAVREASEPSHAASGVDSSALFVFLTTGIIGGLLWLYFLLWAFWLGYNRTKHKQTKELGYFYVLALTAVVIHSLFINSMFYPWIFIWLMITTGVIDE